MRNSYLSRVNLTGAVLYNSNLSNSDLSWSDITDIQLDSVDLKYVRAFGLTGCVDWNLPTHLRCTNDGLTQFETSSIVGPYVNLSICRCLSNANLTYADLSNANLVNVDLMPN